MSKIRVTVETSGSFVTVTADGEPFFRIRRAAFSKFAKFFPASGEGELDSNRLDQLRADCLFEDGLRHAYTLLGRTDWSVSGLRAKLCEPKDADEPAAGRVVEYLIKNGRLDDESYAADRAQRLKERGYSDKRIVYSLRAEGGGPDLARAAAAGLDTDPVAEIRELIARRYAAKLEADENGPRRVLEALLRRGYAYDDVKSAMEIE